MTASSDRNIADGDDHLYVTRDMLINDRRCTLRVTAAEGKASVTFDATEPDGNTVGSLNSTIALDDLVPVTKAISATLSSAAKALGLTKSKYAAELNDVRGSHPRAGLPWSADEDARLIVRYRGGASLLELSSEFERNVGGIAARLKLHDLRPPSRRDRGDLNPEYADDDAEPDWP
ncbi:hypothetical protein [Actinoplanes sp. NPDC051411]|uniref:hypothetical protein n=1 Tax=Actinoplanes sp. NPDC051411 TaxID=3155522 RepID=UPI003436C3AB